MIIKKYFNKNQVPLVILFLTWVVFFSRTLSTRFVYYLDDLKIIYFPLEWVYAQFQNTGNLPLWSNLFGFGHPLLAWGQLGFFAPLHVVLRLFSVPPLTLLQISIVTYFALGSLGMFLFLRRQGISPISCALGAILFTYSGFNVGHLNHVNFYTTTMLLPWLLLFLHQLILKPSLFSSVLVIIVSASMALSGQPQVVLYSFLIAALWFMLTFLRSKSRIKLVLFILLAGLISFALASFAVLPLSEFLPSTDRADGLSVTELFGFSYPPQHAITLILPYFFGDHNYYWGAKNFQELAAYLGIIPLLLVGAGLIFPRSHRLLKIFGLVLLVAGIVFALGRHSPIYSWLVNSGYITSIAIPGRFVFFFVFGVSILATLGMENIIRASLKRRIASLAVSLGFLGILLGPFLIYSFSSPDALNYFVSYIKLTNVEPILVLLGFVAMVVAIFIPREYFRKFRLSYILVGICSLTLISYGWNYNPVTARSIANASSPFASALAEYNQNNDSPARLYQIEHPIISARRRTEPISNTLSIYQPVISRGNSISCFTVPFRLIEEEIIREAITVSLVEAIGSEPIRSTTIKPNYLAGSKLEICFDPVPSTPGDKYYLSFTSEGNSGTRLIYQPTTNKDLWAYLIRVEEPSDKQIVKSQKPISIIFNEHGTDAIDQETAKIARHLNVTVGASSANWVGALANNPFRNFVSSLLADDLDPVQYNSEEIIENFRTIIDLAGITHVIETAIVGTDYEYLSSSGFEYQDEISYDNTSLRLYTNPNVYPKAWLGKQAVFAPVTSETINIMRQGNFNPKELIYISGPTPPEQISSSDTTPLQGSAEVTKYDSTAVDIQVSTNQMSWLIFNDSTSPQWKTYIDGKPAPGYIAFATFKAAQVPAGNHKVSFRFESSATNLAYRLTSVALLVLVILGVVVVIQRPRAKSIK